MTSDSQDAPYGSSTVVIPAVFVLNGEGSSSAVSHMVSDPVRIPIRIERQRGDGMTRQPRRPAAKQSPK